MIVDFTNDDRDEQPREKSGDAEGAFNEQPQERDRPKPGKKSMRDLMRDAEEQQRRQQQQ